MRRIYAIILGSSLLSAVVIFLISSLVFTGPEFGIGPRGLAATFVSVFLGVWLGFLICREAIRRNRAPGIWMAVGTGFLVGGFGFLVMSAGFGNLTKLSHRYPPGLAHPLSEVMIYQFQIFLQIILSGAVIGVILGVINFLVWSRLDVISQLVVRQIQGK